jgi:hypothetical protein
MGPKAVFLNLFQAKSVQKFCFAFNVEEQGQRVFEKQ